MKKIIIVLLGMLVGNQLWSQQDAMLSQYMFNGLFLNPAYAGSHKYWSSTFTYRNQWVAMDGAPETAILAVDGPIASKNMGLGFSFMYDKIGVSTHNKFTANYSYQLRTSANYNKISKNHRGNNRATSARQLHILSFTIRLG